MDKTKQKIIITLAAVVIGVGGFWAYSSSIDSSTENTATEVVQTVGQTAELVSSEDEKSVSYEGQTDKTALEVLKTLANVTTENSGFGEFVTGINGVEADSSKEYWSFYVDGDYASEGAGTYKTTDGEKIEWRLEQLL